MSDKIVLVGGGGHCRSILNTILKSEMYKDIVITDTSIPADTLVMGVKVVGDETMLPDLIKSGYKNAVIAIGSIKDTRLRRKKREELSMLGFEFPAIIDSSAVISEYSHIGQGTFVGANVSVNAGAVISDFAIINTGAIIEHDCTVGEFTHISVGAKLCGSVYVGGDALIGAGATVIQGIKISNRAVVGAGSVVIADVAQGQTVCGVPAGVMHYEQ